MAEVEKPKPVVRAEQMKIIRAKASRMRRVEAQAAQAREEFYESIRDAFDAGLTWTPISEAAGISKERAKQIRHHR